MGAYTTQLYENKSGYDTIDRSSLIQISRKIRRKKGLKIKDDLLSGKINATQAMRINSGKEIVKCFVQSQFPMNYQSTVGLFLLILSLRLSFRDDV